MKQRTKIFLPIVIAFVGILAVVAGRQGQVSADVYSQASNTLLYVVLTASGFLLIAVAAIIALFMIASSEDNKK